MFVFIFYMTFIFTGWPYVSSHVRLHTVSCYKLVLCCNCDAFFYVIHVLETFRTTAKRNAGKKALQNQINTNYTSMTFFLMEISIYQNRRTQCSLVLLRNNFGLRLPGRVRCAPNQRRNPGMQSSELFALPQQGQQQVWLKNQNPEPKSG